MKSQHFLLIVQDADIGIPSVKAQGILEGNVGQNHVSLTFLEKGHKYRKVLPIEALTQFTFFDDAKDLGAFLLQFAKPVVTKAPPPATHVEMIPALTSEDHAPKRDPDYSLPLGEKLEALDSRQGAFPAD